MNEPKPFIEASLESSAVAGLYGDLMVTRDSLIDALRSPALHLLGVDDLSMSLSGLADFTLEVLEDLLTQVGFEREGVLWTNLTQLLLTLKDKVFAHPKVSSLPELTQNLVFSRLKVLLSVLPEFCAFVGRGKNGELFDGPLH